MNIDYVDVLRKILYYQLFLINYRDFIPQIIKTFLEKYLEQVKTRPCILGTKRRWLLIYNLGDDDQVKLKVNIYETISSHNDNDVKLSTTSIYLHSENEYINLIKYPEFFNRLIIHRGELIYEFLKKPLIFRKVKYGYYNSKHLFTFDINQCCECNCRKFVQELINIVSNALTTLFQIYNSINVNHYDIRNLLPIDKVESIDKIVNKIEKFNTSLIHENLVFKYTFPKEETIYKELKSFPVFYIRINKEYSLITFFEETIVSKYVFEIYISKIFNKLYNQSINEFLNKLLENALKWVLTCKILEKLL